MRLRDERGKTDRAATRLQTTSNDVGCASDPDADACEVVIVVSFRYPLQIQITSPVIKLTRPFC